MHVEFVFDTVQARISASSADNTKESTMILEGLN